MIDLQRRTYIRSEYAPGFCCRIRMDHFRRPHYKMCGSCVPCTPKSAVTSMPCKDIDALQGETWKNILRRSCKEGAPFRPSAAEFLRMVQNEKDALISELAQERQAHI